jgi:lysyl-tRNA synthetase, class II
METHQIKSNNEQLTEMTTPIHMTDEETFYTERITSSNSLLKAYPHKFNKTIEFDGYVKKYDSLQSGEKKVEDDTLESVMGRVTFKRSSGKKLLFYTLTSNGQNLQIMSDVRMYHNADEFKEIHGLIKRGDIVGVEGYPARTKKGELSIIPIKLEILAPCYHTIPHEYFGVADKEIRYGQRYIDLILNNNVRNIFITRSKVISFLRKYLENLDFIEVETPVLNSKAGGATAKPFSTFHNAMKQDMSLRIAPELFLKQLVVGGFDRVFEIGKQFRNESIDLTHNPEFTSCEFYMAGADYYDLMNITEDFLSNVVNHIHGKQTIEYLTNEINFTPPYRRVDMMPELTKIIREKLDDIKFNFPEDLGSEEARHIIIDLCKRINIKCSPPLTTARLIDKLVGEYIEPTCINPTFIMNHPLIMSPLAKDHREYHGLTERFELFINGKEVCNAYTELNNPIIQKERFTIIQNDKALGDDEVPPADMEFVTALEYGLPPTGGWGIGIDRLIMFLCNTDSIREVILFPTRHHNVV